MSRRPLTAPPGEDRLEGFDVASGCQNHVLGDALDNAGTGRSVEVVFDTEGDVVLPTVKMAAQADQLVASGIGTGKPNGHQIGFGAGRSEAQALGRRDQALHAPAPFELQFMAGRRVGAQDDLAIDRLGQRRVGVAQQECSVTAVEIDVFVAVDVPLSPALSPLDIDRVRGHVPRVMHDAAREDLVCVGDQMARANRAFPESGDDRRVGQVEAVHGFPARVIDDGTDHRSDDTGGARPSEAPKALGTSEKTRGRAGPVEADGLSGGDLGQARQGLGIAGDTDQEPGAGGQPKFADRHHMARRYTLEAGVGGETVMGLGHADGEASVVRVECGEGKTTTATLGLRSAWRHLMWKNFSASKSDPPPASVTT